MKFRNLPVIKKIAKYVDKIFDFSVAFKIFIVAACENRL